MTVDTEPPLEVAFAEHVFDQFEFYKLGSGNGEYSNGSETNEYPCVPFCLSDLIKTELPDTNWDLDQKIQDKFFDNFQLFEQEDAVENWGFKPFFDCNGYKLCVNIPVSDLLYRRDQIVNNIEGTDDKDEINEFLEEIRFIDKDLVECGKKLDEFKTWANGLKYIFDGYVVVTDGADYDFVHYDAYLDRKDDYGWQIWDADIEKHCKESCDEFIEEAVYEYIYVPNIKYEGLWRAKNSMVY